MSLRLGKAPATSDERDIRYSVVKAGVALPKPPARFGHGSMFKNWAMLGNGPDDTVAPGFQGAGDCVFAGGVHETMMTNRLAGHPVMFTGRNAIDDYSAVTGYVIGDDQTDQGTNVRDALKYRRKTGLVDAHGVRHKIGAYVALDPKNWDQIIEAVYVFSAVGVGFEFPDTAMDQFNAGKPWDVVTGAYVEGGHYVPAVGRPSSSVLGVVTWAKRQSMTKAFALKYIDEAWAIVYPEELRNGKTERGFNLAQLNAALNKL